MADHGQKNFESAPTELAAKTHQYQSLVGFNLWWWALMLMLQH
jgi:hypothetical protein